MIRDILSGFAERVSLTMDMLGLFSVLSVFSVIVVGIVLVFDIDDKLGALADYFSIIAFCYFAIFEVAIHGGERP